MLNKGKITPLASHKNVNPKLGIADSDRIILDKALENWNAPLRVACVNSYGAAGSNAALLCCEPPSPNPATTTSKSSIVPILISAASKESALSYSKSLAKYLDREHVGMLDLAYTLAERRQHHRFRWSTAASSIADVQYSLGNLSESSFNELPKETGNIVLAFSGQSKHTVGLEKSLYDANPLFRHYIESCNTELVNTGFKSIVPAIFDQNSLDDIVVLQTGTFAVQYACARCWIDAGLKIRAVIGHSFGELTALAVSGAVSLEDGLRIVARRASLMATKWGPERGVMLAVHSNRETVDNLISCVGENEIEIACHNAETSSVLVGSVKSVSKAELLLASDPRFGGIRYQKLDVSHGFHSRFTEPLLPELLSVADSISFQDPNIHLETCTSEANNGVLEPSYLVKHTRSPVHFVDAVHRIEDRLGSCVWLEAGFDSPIIPMIRRATKSKDHSFQPASSGDVTGASNTLGSAVAKLWVNGITASFWPFLSSRETGVKQIWLPPYIFNRSRAWLENVDRATEIQKAVQAGTVAAAPPPPPTHLVTQTRKDAKSAHFEVHIATKRFSSIVSGHAVRRRPLCPASMYMECATMAGQTLAGIQSTTKKYLYFDDLQFESPLGVDLSKKLSLALEDVANSSAWKFVLSSVAPDQPKPTIHARGKLRFGEPAGLEKHQALVFSQMTMLAAKPDTETLMSTRAYGLFSQVVTYADLLKGISSITMDGNHASAVIKLPRDHVGEKETTACNVCDTVSLDAFVQVVGLLINSSDNSTVNDCFVATGIKTTVMTGSCDFLKNKSWTVYARYSMINANKAEGEVFVLKPDYSIAIVFQGISFSKVATSTLEDMLDGINSQSSSDTSAKVNGRSNALKPDTNGAVSSHQRAVYLPEPSPETAHDAIGGSGMNYLNEDLNGASADALNGVSNTSTAAASTPTNSTGSAEPQFAAGGRAAIANDIIKDISGADISMADNDQTLGDLGFDSLAIVQLKNDLEDAFSMELDDVHLGLEIGQLLQLVGADAPTSAKSIASTLEDSQAPNSAEPGKDVVAEPKIAEFTDSPAYIHDLTESLAQSSISLPDMAARRGYHAYWRTVAPRQGDIIVACILEAFRELGIDVRGLKAGEHVAHINSLPRYKRVLERFFHILQKYAVIERREGQWVRTPKRLRETPSEVLVEKFVRDFPHYAGEARLIAITGPKLDACLTGKTDPIALLFSSRESQDALENYYFNSPMLATATDLLVDVVRRSVAASKGDLVRIIEIGAGCK
jgi:acyl transferase domain-containing protein